MTDKENNIVENISFPVRIPIQMRTTDIDMYQHLNNTRYLDYYDLGKAEYFAAANRLNPLWRLERPLTVIVNVNCSFIKSIVFGETVSVLTRCEHIGDKSFVLHQIIVGEDDSDIRSECHTVMVCIDPETRKSIPMPQPWRNNFEHLENHPID